MAFSIGLDIGGTKIAGAIFDQERREVSREVMPTPQSYSDLVTTCAKIIEKLEGVANGKASVGVGIPGDYNYAQDKVQFAANTPCIVGQPLGRDLIKALSRQVRIENDADCAALSEAIDGAGAQCRTVFGLIMGTGAGGGMVVDRRIVEGCNGMAGEFGHLPLPFREASDGPAVECMCGQKGCIDKSISGPALARLYTSMTGKPIELSQTIQHMQKGGLDERRVLDQFYRTVAKAMITVIHMFDPEIIVVSGGLSGLPGLAEEVPKIWGEYCLVQTPATKFAVAKHGTMSGLRGAAWAGAAI